MYSRFDEEADTSDNVEKPFQSGHESNGNPTREMVSTSDQTPEKGPSRFSTASPSPSANAYGYEELLNGGVPCPTCKGYGRVPKEQEGQLVALIPLKDKRLKPRRTLLYVILAVILCLVGAGLTVFFLIPRNVSLETTTLYITPYFIYINESKNYVAMSLYNPFNVKNDNYLPITIDGAEMTVMYDSKQLNQSVNATSKKIEVRSTDGYGVKMNLTFDEKRDKIASFCIDPRRWVHDLYMEFSVTVNYSYLGHTNQVVLSKGKLVDCGGNNSMVFYSELEKYGW